MWLVIAVASVLATIFYKKNNHKWVRVIFKTFKRDVKALVRFAKLNILLWKWEFQQKTVPKVFSDLAVKSPEKIACYFEDEVWTIREVDAFSNRIANFFLAQGFKRGDAVALLFENRPEYVCIWLGLSKIGVITALINTNLVNDPLVHSVCSANSSAIIFSSEYAKAIQGLQGKVENLKFYQYNLKTNNEFLPQAVDLKERLKSVSDETPHHELNKSSPKDKLLYIYTSGTTGLPKPAVITNIRYIFATLAIHFMTGMREDDVLYDPLPFYHSAGGMIGVGQLLLRGVTIVTRKKFSASNYWKDCQKYNCTVAQYIGEICRYLLVAFENNRQTNHPVRAMYGNGLRPQIWNKFVTHFGIQEMYEFYGATEGNSNIVNIDNTVGAVGFVPPYVSFLYPVTLIKCNEATGEPIRGRDGFCVRCKENEAGVFVGKINPKKALHAFAGYTDQEATKKKILKNVFKPGDMYFNSGDILVRDEYGYFYFKDRTGDTFRWKGENVATSEVEAVISNVVELNDAVVYGVQIPGTEGRAGMAAIVDTNNVINVDNLYKKLKANLPNYAVPLFLRIMNSVPLTGTFKLKKTDLQAEGFDLEKIKDNLYFYDAKQNTYGILTKDVYDDIMNGRLRL